VASIRRGFGRYLQQRAVVISVASAVLTDALLLFVLVLRRTRFWDEVNVSIYNRLTAPQHRSEPRDPESHMRKSVLYLKAILVEVPEPCVTCANSTRWQVL
jgi:hypothetical protein